MSKCKHKIFDMGKGFHIETGSCLVTPKTSIEVFVGLDSSMKMTKRRFPWTEGIELLYPIKNMGVPYNKKEFMKLIDWMSKEIVKNKKVFIGCIGGHGRTGLVLSSLVYVLLQEIDAISYVRENVCSKCVESEEQTDFLYNLYGIKKVKVNKPTFINYNKDKVLKSEYDIVPIKSSWSIMRKTG